MEEFIGLVLFYLVPNFFIYLGVLVRWVICSRSKEEFKKYLGDRKKNAIVGIVFIISILILFVIY